MREDWHLDPLRDNPRFIELMRSAGPEDLDEPGPRARTGETAA